MIWHPIFRTCVKWTSKVGLGFFKAKLQANSYLLAQEEYIVIVKKMQCLHQSPHIFDNSGAVVVVMLAAGREPGEGEPVMDSHRPGIHVPVDLGQWPLGRSWLNAAATRSISRWGN